MGLKDAAKALMEEAGVPGGARLSRRQPGSVRSGWRRPTAIGYPVLIKAVAGGGGKGMRLVERPGLCRSAGLSARSEARPRPPLAMTPC